MHRESQHSILPRHLLYTLGWVLHTARLSTHFSFTLLKIYSCLWLKYFVLIACIIWCPNLFVFLCGYFPVAVTASCPCDVCPAASCLAACQVIRICLLDTFCLTAAAPWPWTLQLETNLRFAVLIFVSATQLHIYLLRDCKIFAKVRCEL